MDVANIAMQRHHAWSQECRTAAGLDCLHVYTCDGCMHTPARLWPINLRLARVVINNLNNRGAVRHVNQKFESVLDSDITVAVHEVVAAAGIFHAVHEHSNLLTGRPAASAAIILYAAGVASTALEDCSENCHDGHRCRL